MPPILELYGLRSTRRRPKGCRPRVALTGRQPYAKDNSSMRLLLALCSLLLATAPVAASLSVCNKSSQTAIVALAHFNGTAWASQGWWHIQPGQCGELIRGPLNARYYYLYATDGAFSTWDGSKNFCVGIFRKVLDRGTRSLLSAGVGRAWISLKSIRVISSIGRRTFRDRDSKFFAFQCPDF